VVCRTVLEGTKSNTLVPVHSASHGHIVVNSMLSQDQHRLTSCGVQSANSATIILCMDDSADASEAIDSVVQALKLAGVTEDVIASELLAKGCVLHLMNGVSTDEILDDM
jgi:hypothetical protein